MLKPNGGRDTYFNIRRLLTLGLDYLKTRNFQITIRANVTVDVHWYVILVRICLHVFFYGVRRCVFFR